MTEREKDDDQHGTNIDRGEGRKKVRPSWAGMD